MWRSHVDDKLMYTAEDRKKAGHHAMVIASFLSDLKSISKSESPKCVSDSLDASGDLHTGYQKEGAADSDTNASEAVTVPLPKRSEDENESCPDCGSSFLYLPQSTTCCNPQCGFIKWTS